MNGQELTIDVKNRFEKGDVVELMTTKGNHEFPLESIINKRGESVEVAPGSGHVVKIQAPEGVDLDEYSLLVRNLPEAS